MKWHSGSLRAPLASFQPSAQDVSIKIRWADFLRWPAPSANSAATEDPQPNWDVKATELPPLQQPKCGIDFLLPLLPYPPKNCPSPDQFPFFLWTQRRQRGLRRFVYAIVLFTCPVPSLTIVFVYKPSEERT
ncbi:hypothetical protein DdX_05254 [Ditylenchus destructor]|uniref:Uncharacterized protein n=1 Tax=Ditylenchus destructor TaxID=166010 RepID=A0AAD4RAW2_9BILA|nr:hypothetical protein DdX_05254 [Ditylenchus destructor]